MMEEEEEKTSSFHIPCSRRDSFQLKFQHSAKYKSKIKDFKHDDDDDDGNEEEEDEEGETLRYISFTLKNNSSLIFMNNNFLLRKSFSLMMRNERIFLYAKHFSLCM